MVKVLQLVVCEWWVAHWGGCFLCDFENCVVTWWAVFMRLRGVEAGLYLGYFYDNQRVLREVLRRHRQMCLTVWDTDRAGRIENIF